jgi:hypothetical protein
MSDLVSNSNAPKKRGRKPGSKNKNKLDQTGNLKSPSVVFAYLEREIALVLGTLHALHEQMDREMERLESRHQKSMDRMQDKYEGSLKIWKSRAKDYRKKLTLNGGKKRNVGRPASVPLKVAARRGRPIKANPRKGGGRKKAGELTKRDIILNFMQQHKEPITSKDLIQRLFALSGEKEYTPFSQGIYTTLTQIYKRGLLLNEDGFIRLPE